MAVHMVVVAAIHLSRAGGGGGAAAQVVTGLVWPYLVKVCLRMKVARHDLVTSSRFFLFQVARIITVEDDDDDHSLDDRTANNNSNSNNNNNTRWVRALRLVRQRLALLRGVSSSQFDPHDEDSLRILSQLAL